jgi:hypothetical protein
MGVLHLLKRVRRGQQIAPHPGRGTVHETKCASSIPSTGILAVDCHRTIDYAGEGLRIQASPERRQDNETSCRNQWPSHCGSGKHAVDAE